jgi:hypothetical protein
MVVFYIAFTSFQAVGYKLPRRKNRINEKALSCPVLPVSALNPYLKHSERTRRPGGDLVAALDSLADPQDKKQFLFVLPAVCVCSLYDAYHHKSRTLKTLPCANGAPNPSNKKGPINQS